MLPEDGSIGSRDGVSDADMVLVGNDTSPPSLEVKEELIAEDIAVRTAEASTFETNVPDPEEANDDCPSDLVRLSSAKVYVLGDRVPGVVVSMAKDSFCCSVVARGYPIVVPFVTIHPDSGSGHCAMLLQTVTVSVITRGVAELAPCTM